MRRMRLTLLFIVIGLSLLFYPQVSKYLYDGKMMNEIKEYEKKISETDKGILKKEWNKAVIYNQNLKGDPVRDPFIEGSGVALPKNYLEVLNFPEKTMGNIKIPKINVNLSIYHGTSERVLQKGIGHMEGTALPIGGEGMHSVITGHTGLAHSKMFTDLTQLKEKDLFYIYVLGEELAYEVDQIKVVSPDNLKYLEPEKGKDQLTLITCTPYGINSHRLLVRGKRVPFKEEEKDKIIPIYTKTEEDIILQKAIIITSGVMGSLVFLAYLLSKKKRNI